MNHSHSYTLILGAILSFCAAIFQLAIALVPAWSDAFGAGEALVSNPPLLLASGVLVTLLIVIFGLYGLSGAGVIRRLPLLRPALLAIGMLYMLVGVNFIFQVMALLGLIPVVGPIPLHIVLISLGALVASLCYLIGAALNWKQLGRRPVPAPAG